MIAAMVLALMLTHASPLPADAATSECILRVHVVDEHAEPVAGARLGAHSQTTGARHPHDYGGTLTDEQGRAELQVPRDLYRWAVASDRYPTTPERTLDLRRSCEAGDLGRVELDPGDEIRGRVVDTGGGPLAEATVEVSSHEATPDYLLQRRGMLIEPHRATLTAVDGSFTLAGLSPEIEHTLYASHPRHLPSQARGRPGADPVVFRLDPAASVAVEVVDPDGRPIAGAEVRVQALGSGEVAGGIRVTHRTDTQGRHEARGLEPGQAAIEVRAPGYEHGRRVVELEAGTLRSLRFELSPVPSGEVTLRVVDQDGEPLPEAPVSLASLPRGPGTVYLSRRTDPRGRVSWPRVPHGRYELQVQVPEGVLAERPEPRVLEVGPGELHHDLVLRRPEGRPVEGRVAHPDGTGVPGAFVRLHAVTALEAVTRADGSFRFDHLPYGEHSVYLSIPGVVGIAARKAMVADGAVPWLFEVPRGIDLSGRLLVPPGLELEGEWRVTGRGQGGGHAQGWIEGESRYRLPPLVPGQWTVEARNGRARGQVEVELSPGDEDVRRDLPVEPPSGVPVTGILLHRGKPLAGARVGFSSTDHPSRSIGDTTDAGGRFHLTEVPPGTYRFGIAWGGVPVLQRVVEIDGPVDLRRELRFAWLRGRVEVEGIDPSTLHVRLSPLGPEEGGHWYITSHSYPEFAVPHPDGTFEAGPLAEGRWRIEVSAPGHAEAGREIVIDGADVDDLVLAPEPTPGLTFRVVNARGSLPDHVSATYRPEEGDEVRGYFEDLEPVLHLATAPPGRGFLEVDAGYGEVGPIPVEVPGPVVEVELPARGKIEVHALALESAEARRAVLTVRPVEADEPVWTRSLRVGRASIVLPPGLFEVRLEAADGRTWTDVAEVRDQETTRVDLR